MREFHRQTKYSRSKLPRQKRTLRLYGEKDDTDILFRCWNCLFIVDSTKHSVEHGEYGKGGVTTETYTDTDGITKYKPVVMSGCPFCGSTNYR